MPIIIDLFEKNNRRHHSPTLYFLRNVTAPVLLHVLKHTQYNQDTLIVLSKQNLNFHKYNPEYFTIFTIDKINCV